MFCQEEMIKMFEIIPKLDENSIHILCSRLSLPIEDLDAEKIKWEVGNTYEENGIMYMPIKAIGYRFKNQSSDEELRQALEQLPLTRLSDLYAEQSHTDCRCHPILEIQPTPFPDGTPLLHKE